MGLLAPVLFYSVVIGFGAADVGWAQSYPTQPIRLLLGMDRQKRRDWLVTLRDSRQGSPIATDIVIPKDHGFMRVLRFTTADAHIKLKRPYPSILP